ncbi:hypothetical protein [Fodinibius sediminis]|uniref:Uncharacterized protein n=1 Tax=Fodinibius sediminis TaxID=1214077 RepID=A0A521BW91_9BACT|nr:hypothetical protein [Fodinibius sediminis]SMO51454.1 hypothetical protein SAMN06265218_10498 [Fodinibius sediminis]
MGYKNLMKTCNIENLTETEIRKINGGKKDGTLADEIGYFLGSIWGSIVTSHRARARGQLLAH